MVPFHSLGATAQLKELLRGEHLICLSSAPASVPLQHQTTRSQPCGSFQNLLTRHSARGKVLLTHPPLIYCLLTFQHSVNGYFILTQVHLHLLLFEEHIVFTPRSFLSQTAKFVEVFQQELAANRHHLDAVGAVSERKSSETDQEIQSVQI